MKVAELLKLSAAKLREPMDRVRRHSTRSLEDAPPDVREYVELAREAEDLAGRLDDFVQRAGALLGRG